VRKDGTRVSVEFTIVLFSDDAGRMIGIAAIMRDATARFANWGVHAILKKAIFTGEVG
jgi:hypothetical protein